MNCKFLPERSSAGSPTSNSDLDTTLKQRYASQLSDCNNGSIAKTLLKQMPQITFTQFCNELARVLGTRQCAVTKASVKTVMEALAETESERGGSNDQIPK